MSDCCTWDHQQQLKKNIEFSYGHGFCCCFILLIDRSIRTINFFYRKQKSLIKVLAVNKMNTIIISLELKFN